MGVRGPGWEKKGVRELKCGRERSYSINKSQKRGLRRPQWGEKGVLTAERAKKGG